MSESCFGFSELLMLMSSTIQHFSYAKFSNKKIDTSMPKAGDCQSYLEPNGIV